MEDVIATILCDDTARDVSTVESIFAQHVTAAPWSDTDGA